MPAPRLTVGAEAAITGEAEAYTLVSTK
jgi:hypothetical protein